MLTFTADQLRQLASRIFQGAGTPAEIADEVAGSLVSANLAGHDSHGVIRVSSYVDQIRKGEYQPAAQPEIIADRGCTATVDGNWGFGQITARFAVDLAIEKAKEHQVSAVAAIGCNHIGRLGEWAERAIAQDVVAMVTVSGTSWRLGAPYGGAARALGTDPISFGIPGGSRGDLLLDYATTVVAEGKLRVARDKNTLLPPGCILDKDGNPSTNAEDFYAGGMLLPFGNHKGYALGMVVQMLSLVVTGADEKKRDPDYASGTFIWALDAHAFRSPESYERMADAVVDKVKSVPPAPGSSGVLLPGDPERISREERLKNGIPLPEATWEAMQKAAQSVGVSV